MRELPEDFTIYRDARTSHKLVSLLNSSRQVNKSVNETVKFTIKLGDKSHDYLARALICSCWRQKAISITLRVKLDDQPSAKIQDNSSIFDLGEIDSAELLDSAAIPAVSIPSPRPQDRRPNSDKNHSPFLFHKSHITQALFPAIFDPLREAVLTQNPDSAGKVMEQGLVIISGQTGSMKSQLMQSLAKRYLKSFDVDAWGKRGRLPHVLTFEDPIETPLIEEKQFFLTMKAASQRPFDFTPCDLNKDLKTLDEGLQQALRQTPALVIVGEVRKEKEWETLLAFAATGHLCMTTTHAGSLVETMRKIVEATKAFTPDLRSSLVEKILAIVHLKKFSIRKETNEKFESMVVPALWRNAHGSANFFVSDGLGAILPRRHTLRSDRPASSCRGRTDFVEVLLGISGCKSDDREIYDPIRRITLVSDLKGV